MSVASIQLGALEKIRKQAEADFRSGKISEAQYMHVVNSSTAFAVSENLEARAAMTPGQRIGSGFKKIVSLVSSAATNPVGTAQQYLAQSGINVSTGFDTRTPPITVGTPGTNGENGKTAKSNGGFSPLWLLLLIPLIGKSK
jgi:hypothetical protein